MTWWMYERSCCGLSYEHDSSEPQDAGTWRVYSLATEIWSLSAYIHIGGRVSGLVAGYHRLNCSALSKQWSCEFGYFRHVDRCEHPLVARLASSQTFDTSTVFTNSTCLNWLRIPKAIVIGATLIVSVDLALRTYFHLSRHAITIRRDACLCQKQEGLPT